MTKVTIMSYNIHSGEGLDEKIDYTRMANMLSSHSPDVIGIQEVAQDFPRSRGVFPLEALGKILNMKGEFGKTIHVDRPGTDYDYGIGFLSRFPYEYVKKIPLPNIEGLEPRVAQFVRIKSPVEFYFVNTHLGIGGKDREAVHRMRRDQLAAINAELDRLLAEKALPCVITGDFNARPDSPCIKLLSSTWNVTDLEQYTFPADGPTHKIDYIAVRGAVRCLDFSVIDEKVISDHCPIRAELEFA